MRKLMTIILATSLVITLSNSGEILAFADTDTVDCSPCHGDAHTPGEDNPHGYQTINESDKTLEVESTEEVSDSTEVSDQVDKTKNTDEASSETTINTSNGNLYPSPENLTLETIGGVIEDEYTKEIESLKSEEKTLLSNLDSYEAYKENLGNIENFYQKITNNTQVLCVVLKEYILKYTELILDSDLSNDEKSLEIDNALIGDIFLKTVYKVDSDIYDGILKNFHEGLSKTALDSNQNIEDFLGFAYEIIDDNERYGTTQILIKDENNKLITDFSIFFGNIKNALKYNDIDHMQLTLDNFKQNINNEKQALSVEDNEKSSLDSKTSNPDITEESISESSSSDKASTNDKVDGETVSSYSKNGFLIPFFIDVIQTKQDDDGASFEFPNGSNVSISIYELESSFSLSTNMSAAASALTYSMTTTTELQSLAVENAVDAMYISGENEDPAGILYVIGVEKTDGSQWMINVSGSLNSAEEAENICSSIVVLS